MLAKSVFLTKINKLFFDDMSCEQKAWADTEALFFLDGGDDFLNACALTGEMRKLRSRPGYLPEQIISLTAQVRALRLAYEAWGSTLSMK